MMNGNGVGIKKKVMLALPRTLGDVLLGTTICRELMRDDPGLEIHYFVDKPYAGLLANNPDIAEVRAPDVWNTDLLFMAMADRSFDVVYAPYQARGECNMWHQREETRRQHLLDFYWARMGMHRRIEERECYVYPSESDYAASEQHITMDVPRVAIHSTSGVATKDWPYFTELTEDLRKAGYAAVQVGARSDKKVDGAIDFRGKMGLLEVAAFISKCAAFVGLDSGLSYLADAVKTPTIAIQGSTSPVTSGPISGRVVHLFAKETGYSDCQEVRCHTNCRHEINCNTKIGVRDVMEALDPILKNWEKPIPAGV